MRTKKLGFIKTIKSIHALPYLDLMLAGSKADRNRLQTYNSDASTAIPPPTHSVSALVNLPHLFQRTDTPNVRIRRAEWSGALQRSSGIRCNFPGTCTSGESY